jgi:hypothetical protein
MNPQLIKKLIKIVLILFMLGSINCLAATESVYPDSVIPTERSQDDPYELGTIFRSSVPGLITSVRVYSLAEESGDHNVWLWRNSDNTLLAGPIVWTYGGTDGWITLPITPLAISANTDYTVAISVQRGFYYPIVSHYFDAPGNNGQHLSYPVAAGVFIEGEANAGTRPTKSYNNGAYLRDVVFEPDLTVAVMGIQGNGIVISDGDTTPSALDGTQFGGVDVLSGTREQTFSIHNPGGADLNLTGTPAVVVTGPQADDFHVITQPAGLVPKGGGSNAFVIRFDPSAAGPRFATVVITNSASPTTPFEFAIGGTGTSVALVGNTESDGRTSLGRSLKGSAFQPQTDLRITRLNANIVGAANYSCAVYAANGDGGSPGSLLRTSATLTNAADGWLELPLTEPLDLLSSQSYWFMIWSDNGATEISMQSGVVANTTRWRDQPNDWVFGEWIDPLFTMGSGTGTCSIYSVGIPLADLPKPIIVVKGNDMVIPDGKTTTTALDGTQYSGVDIARGTREHTFTISNPGGLDLKLTGTPVVQLTGPQATDFSVTAQPNATTVPIGGSVSFTVRFAPTAVGPRGATVVITNSASTAQPFQFAIEGQGVDRQHQTLFPDTLTSKSFGPDNAGGYELGTVFRTAVAGLITQVRVYALATESGDHNVSIWRNSPGELLFSTTWNFAGATGWLTLDIDDVPVDADSDYTLSISTGDVDYYPFVGSYFNTAGGNGVDLSYPAGAGVLGGKGQGRPTGVFGAKANYLRDIVFKANLSKPIIVVKGNDTGIADGDTTPSAVDGTDFSGVDLANGTREHTFIIDNPGVVDLNLTGTPVVGIAGTQATDFHVLSQPSLTTVPGGSNVAFTVQFDATALGPRGATVVISNSASPEKPFEFAIAGQGVDRQQQTLFPDALTSAAGGPDNGSGYELGTVFRTATPGMVTHVRVYALAEEWGDHAVNIWRNSPEQLLFSTNWLYGLIAGWITLDIPDLQLEANADYTVSVSTGDVDYYPFVGHYFDGAGGNGVDLSYPAGAGVLGTKGQGRPTGVFAARASYLRDIVFAPAMRITHIQRQPTGGILIRWDGGGSLFQVLKANTADGQFVPLSGNLATSEYVDLTAPADQPQKFYRILKK